MAGTGEGKPQVLLYGQALARFTHEGNATAEDEKLVKDGMAPLANADGFGAILMQFPISFQNTPDNRQYVAQLQRKFGEYPLVLEVRHRS